MAVSAEDFSAVQKALLDIKQERYELAGREARALKELSAAKAQLMPAGEATAHAAVAQDGLAKAKDGRLLADNEALKKALQQQTAEARDQQEVFAR